MRIIYIAAGAGGMHCGACERDVNLVRGLNRLGCDVRLVPLYTPLRIDGRRPRGTSHVFFGGISVYLQQKSPVFRHVPDFVDRLLESRALLNFAARFAIQTKPAALGAMTVSVLRGEHGHQRRELARLLRFLHAERPDLVNLTNALLSAIAPQVKERLGAPVACTLQGEDSFVDDLGEPYRSEARALMQANARHIDLFLAPGDVYAARMAEFLDVPRSNILVVRPGVDTALFRPAPTGPAGPFTIGCLSRIAPSKGLDLIVEAFIELVKRRNKDVVLQAAGRIIDRGFWRAVQERLAAEGVLSRFRYAGEPNLAGKIAFLQSSSVFCTASRYYETRGMAALEAMAAGLPAVLPESGIFPEILTLTGGGVPFPPGDAHGLADALARLADDPAMTDALGKAARRGVADHFSSVRMAQSTFHAYTDLLAGEHAS